MMWPFGNLNLAVKEKIAILDKVKSLPLGTSQRKITEKLCVPKSTVAKLVKEEVILRENFNSIQTGDQKRKPEGKYPDEALSEWFFNDNKSRCLRVWANVEMLSRRIIPENRYQLIYCI